MRRSRVPEVFAASALVLTIVVLILIITWRPAANKLEAFEGSTGFLMTSEPADTLSAAPYMTLDQRRSAGASDGEIALATDPRFGTIGTYAGTLVDTCDVSVLGAHLAGDDGLRGARWATAAGIAPSQVTAFVGGLQASALVAAETFELHGDDDGTRVSSTKLLEAGTAVLIDAEGVPRVRCLDGNPITASLEVAAATATPPAAPVEEGESTEPAAASPVESASSRNEVPLADVDFGSCRLLAGSPVYDAAREVERTSEGEVVVVDGYAPSFDSGTLQGLLDVEPPLLVDVVDLEGLCDVFLFTFMTTDELVVFGQPGEVGSSGPVRSGVVASMTGRMANGFVEIVIPVDNIEQLGWVQPAALL